MTFMTDFFKATMISLIISIILLLVLFAVTSIHIGFVIAMAFVYSAILFFDLMLTGIIKKFRKNISIYTVFAVINFIIGIGISIYSIYDIKTKPSFSLGLIGSFSLPFVIPFIAVLLITDLIVWRKNR